LKPWHQLQQPAPLTRYCFVVYRVVEPFTFVFHPHEAPLVCLANLEIELGTRPAIGKLVQVSPFLVHGHGALCSGVLLPGVVASHSNIDQLLQILRKLITF
jgi:hypothetical protein